MIQNAQSEGLRVLFGDVAGIQQAMEPAVRGNCNSAAIAARPQLSWRGFASSSPRTARIPRIEVVSAVPSWSSAPVIECPRERDSGP